MRIGMTLGLVAVLVCARTPRGLAQAAPVGGDPEAAQIEAALKKHCAYLAGPELKGRLAWEDRKKAADYVAAGFE
jgi:hypothetical protein